MSQTTLWQLLSGEKKEKIETDIHQAEKIELSQPSIEKNEYGKTIPADIKIDETVSKIIVLMEEEQLYQEPEFSLQQLSNKLQTPSYLISQAINTGMKKNFYEFINGYRVEKAKRLLVDAENRNYTILSIGFEAGFNSKTTFNTVFKKFTGFTPTEYRDKTRLKS
jgi:YesN/AraC family two-component response regulator